MQEYTQEKVDRAEHMGIAIPADVKEQIFEYANLIGEEEKVRTLVRNLANAVRQKDQEGVEDLLDDTRMDIYADRKNDGPANLRDCPEENSRCTY